MKLTPGRLDAHEGLARGNRRVGDLLEAEGLGAAGRVDADRLHGVVEGGASGKETTFFLIGFSVFRKS